MVLDKKQSWEHHERDIFKDFLRALESDIDPFDREALKDLRQTIEQDTTHEQSIDELLYAYEHTEKSGDHIENSMDVEKDRVFDEHRSELRSLKTQVGFTDLVKEKRYTYRADIWRKDAADRVGVLADNMAEDLPFLQWIVKKAA